MRKREFKFHPALLLFMLTILIMIVSSVGGILNLETTYYNVNSVSGELETQIVTINNLFNRTGIQYLVSNMLPNFINFAPLGALIIGLMGVGVAYKSGFLNTFFKMVTKDRSRKLFTFLVVFLGVISSMFYEVGYVILIPMAAILFMNLGRHPSSGICAAFAGITFGYGANIIVNGLDNILIAYTQNATKILDQSYVVSLSGNIIFMIVATLLISYVGMIVTEKYVVPKLGRYTISEEDGIDLDSEVTKKEKKGVIVALISTGILSLIIIYCIVPGLPFSGLFLYLKDTTYVAQLFGENSYFNQGAVFIFSALLAFAGLIYGMRTRTIKNSRDLMDGMNYYLKGFSSLLVMIFFAAQFCLIFKETNIGVFIVASLSELMDNLQLTGFVLIIFSFVIIGISSIFVPMASTKWAILSPVMVPMFMQSSFTPEFAQAVFRAADSSVKGMTPLFTYFVILIGFLQIYNTKKKDTISLVDAMGLMAPYSIAFSILWLLIIIGFYIIGLPLGFNTGVML
ncbi:MAG: AbgT family transporter [Bacilli bacterium]|nr:AbgT family transporter [Bacilli bacterium]